MHKNTYRKVGVPEPELSDAPTTKAFFDVAPPPTVKGTS